MEVIEKYLSPSHSFVKDYIEENDRALSFFDYTTSEEDTLERFAELRAKEKSYDKKELYDHLYSYNQTFLHHKKALEELHKLKDSSAVMVVGGQQAGLLSGPLYTISKAITILKEARLQESLLQVPVIPVFWIAGEDHDWEEVNHVYMPKGRSVCKYTYKGSWKPGAPMSNQTLDIEAFHRWWDTLLKDFPETTFTSDLRSMVSDLSRRQSTMTGFFGEIMRWLFRDTGLVMLDAHHPEVRRMERRTFSKMLHSSNNLQKAIQHGREHRAHFGYELPYDLPQDDSIHIFYQASERRHLLYTYNEKYVTDRKKTQFYRWEEILKELEDNPERFSANVYTRPLVQEELLPVLSFVAGPGEINYWSLLKPLFQTFGNKIPPVLPRLSYTLISRTIQSTMRKTEIGLSEWLTGQAEKKFLEWLHAKKEVDGQQLAQTLLEQMEPYHERMREAWESVAPSEKSYGETNWAIIQREVNKFAYRINLTQEQKEQKHLDKWKQVEQWIRPYNKPQERVLNIMWFVNNYGFDVVHKIYEVDVERNHAHKVIYL